MKASLAPTTRIDLATDPDSKRYALGSVCASPTRDGKVLLTACDGRILAAVRVDGDIPSPIAIPAKVFAAPMKRGKVNITRENGHWIDRRDTIHTANDAPGRFPRANDVIPDVSHREGMRVIGIDAQLLLNLAKAINDTSAVVQLIFDDSARSGMMLTGPIAVHGTVGNGVIMPVTGDTKDAAAKQGNDAVTKYAAFAEGYRAEFVAFKPEAAN